MPDPPPSKRRSRATQQSSTAVSGSEFSGSGAGYAELHCRTNYSFLEGASHADELAARAKELGYAALAVTDRNSLAGVVRAHVAAKEAGLKLLVGAEIVPEDGPALVLLASDRGGYGRLSRLITKGRLRGEKGVCRISSADIAEASEGLICCVPLSRETQLRYAGLYRPGADAEVSDSDLQRLQAIFGERCYALAELHHGPRDSERLEQWLRRCGGLQLPVAAANDVHFHIPRRRPLQDVLTAIRCNASLQELGHELFPNGERHLKPIRQLEALFRGHGELLERTVEIAGCCGFSLDELRYEYPEELVPRGLRPIEHLANLTWQGAAQRYVEGVPERVRQLVRHELSLIEELQYEAYFLTVYDLVRFAIRWCVFVWV